MQDNGRQKIANQEKCHPYRLENEAEGKLPETFRVIGGRKNRESGG